MRGQQSHPVPAVVRDEIELALVTWATLLAAGNAVSPLTGATVGQYMPGVYSLTLADGTKYKLRIETMPVYHVAEGGA